MKLSNKSRLLKILKKINDLDIYGKSVDFHGVSDAIQDTKNQQMNENFVVRQATALANSHSNSSDINFLLSQHVVHEVNDAYIRIQHLAFSQDKLEKEKNYLVDKIQKLVFRNEKINQMTNKERKHIIQINEKNDLKNIRNQSRSQYDDYT